MNEITLEVPVFKLAPVAESALKQMRENADEEWNKKVDELWKKNKKSRWFWVGKLMYSSREDLEEEMGKVEKPSQMVVGTQFQKIYMQTRQVAAYKDFIELMKYKPDSIVTLPVEDYNVLMTWDGEGVKSDE